MTRKKAIQESLVKWRAIVERTERGVLVSPWRDEEGVLAAPFNTCVLCDLYAHFCRGCPLDVDGCAPHYFRYEEAVDDRDQPLALASAKAIVAKLEAAS